MSIGSYAAHELMQMQYAGLYNLDPQGRMRSVNEPGTPPAPRFFMGRTAEGHVVGTHADLPADLAALLHEICAAEPTPDDLEAAPQYAATIRSLLGSGSEEYRGPAFVVPATIPDLPGAVLIDNERLDSLRTHYDWLVDSLADYAPIAAVLVDGITVSVCFSSRSRPTYREAGVNTAEEFRGRGYAQAATATWARAVQAQGITAIYSTSWDNTASRGIARSLGLHMFGENWNIA